MTALNSLGALHTALDKGENVEVFLYSSWWLVSRDTLGCLLFPQGREKLRIPAPSAQKYRAVELSPGESLRRRCDCSWEMAAALLKAAQHDPTP